MFKIVISEHKEVKTKTRSAWKVVEQRPLTKKELEESTFDESSYKTKLKDVYGYTPQIETTTIEEQEIYTQQVESLNIGDVIASINNQQK